jgi:hypothetical protein
MCVDVAGRQPILISKRSDQDRKSVTPLASHVKMSIASTKVFNIGGPPRLVLITCAGKFRPDRGGQPQPDRGRAACLMSAALMFNR